MKLLALDAPAARRAHWKDELHAWLRKISVLRLKPNNAKPPAAWLFELLYEEPFGGVEEQNVAGLVALHAAETQRPNGRTPREVARRVEAFHRALAERLAAGDPGEDLLAAL